MQSAGGESWQVLAWLWLGAMALQLAIVRVGQAEAEQAGHLRAGLWGGSSRDCDPAMRDPLPRATLCQESWKAAVVASARVLR